MRRINVFDTTLRDGQQSPGSAFDLEKKLEVGRQLERLNVDVIEAGFPFASKVDFDSVNILSKELVDTKICAFARAKIGDIEIAAKAFQGYSKSRIQIVTPISDLHLMSRLGKDRKQGLMLIREGLSAAKDLFAEVSWIAEDASRADPDYLIESFNTAVDYGAKIVTYADTVGFSLPNEISSRLSLISKSINSDAILGIHCHNDLGLGVANTLSAIEAGVQEFQCTITGIGERAGNASLEEIVMALKVKKIVMDAYTEVDSRLLNSTCELVSRYSNSPIPKNKPIVGENAFAHCSGMHQHGVLSDRENYEIMNPEDLGINARGIVIGKHSGKHGVKHILNEEGITVKNNKLNALMQRIKLLEDGKYLSPRELVLMLRKINGI